MGSELISFIVGLAAGFLLGVYWMFRRRRSRQPGEATQTSASGIADVVRDDTVDPMSALDRRMAYGEYKEAAEIVESQIANNPSDLQLKAKLLEIYFVWGSEEKFLTAFREYESELRPSRYWTQVHSMGAQLFPNDQAFAGS